MKRSKYFLILLALILSYGIVYALSGSLATNVTTNGGCEGAFFDVTALNRDILITSFDTVFVGTANVRVYYRVGSYSGRENSSSGWNFLGSQNMVGGSGFIQTLYPLDAGDVLIPAGQTYGFLIYSGYISTGTLAIRMNAASSVTVSDSYIQIDSDTCSEGGGTFTLFDGISTNYAWRGVVYYQTVPPETTAYEFQDGRINRFDLAAPFAVYPHQDETGETGLVVYDAYHANTLLLVVSAAQIAAVEEFPAVNTLIAESEDERVAVYRLTDGQFQIMGPSQAGKTYVLIFPEIRRNVEYTSSEE